MNQATPESHQPVATKKRVFICIFLATCAICVAACLGIVWIFKTPSGRDFTLTTARAYLPTGVHISWKHIDGTLAGPMHISGLDIQTKTVHLYAQDVTWDTQLQQLLTHQKLTISQIQVAHTTVDLAKDNSPFTLPQWPDILPQLHTPLTIEITHCGVDDLRILQQHVPVIAISSARTAANITSQGLILHFLDMQSDRGTLHAKGTYFPQHHYATHLIARATIPSPSYPHPIALGLALEGTQRHFEVALSGYAPGPFATQLVIEEHGTHPQWQWALNGKRLDTSQWSEHAKDTHTPANKPFEIHLRAQSVGEAIHLSGTYAQGDMQLALQPSKIALDKTTLVLAPLRVSGFHGNLEMRGRIQLPIDNARIHSQLTLTAEGLDWQNAEHTMAMRIAHGHATLEGTPDAWSTTTTTQLIANTHPLQLTWQAHGNRSTATLSTLHAQTEDGHMDGHGILAWSPTLRWDGTVTLHDFDPALFAPSLPGKISAEIKSQGQQRATPQTGTLSDYQIDIVAQHGLGTLRQRPLRFSGNYHWLDNQGHANLELHLGNTFAKMTGRIATQCDLNVTLNPLDLADLVPEAQGHLQGNLRIQGNIQAPTVSADVQGDQLLWKTYRIKHLVLQGTMPWRGALGHLHLEADDTQLNTHHMTSLTVDTQGSVEHLNTSLAIASDVGTLAMTSGLARTPKQWQGTVSTFALRPKTGAPWKLAAPMHFALQADLKHWSVQHTCLGTQANIHMCIDADWPTKGLWLESQGLTLALLNPWLPQQSQRATLLQGNIELFAHIHPDAGAYVGTIRAQSPSGSLTLGDSAFAAMAGNLHPSNFFRYDHFSMQIDLSKQAIAGKLGIGFQGDGYIDTKIHTDWRPHAPIDGQMYMYMAKIAWLELFLPDVIAPKAIIQGHVSLQGTRDAPLMGGQLTLSQASAQYPAMGLNITNGQGTFTAQPDGSAKIHAQAQLGTAPLYIDGTMSWFGDATPFQLHLFGKNLNVYNTNEIQISANPDLNFSFKDRLMHLSGQVTIPQAKIDLERLDQGATTSPDVQIMDDTAQQKTHSPPSALDMDVHIVVGNAVSLHGFGLTGTLAGNVGIRMPPQQEMIGNGVLDLQGRYRAYGQDLTISKGQLVWNNNSITDPRLLIRAERKIGDVTAGVDVSGRVESPRAQVWSDPSMSQSEALSYIVLGHGLSTATSGENDRIDAASAALSAGGGLVGSQLGAKFGLDDAGMSQSATLGSSVFGVGKYILPRLYVGYGVSLVSSGSVLNVKYILEHGFDIEVESSTAETRSSINWRKER